MSNDARCCALSGIIREVKSVDEERRPQAKDDDRDVALYHVVYAHEGFEESAHALFMLVPEPKR